MKLDLLSPGIEVGLVTTDPDAVAAFYEGFLEVEPLGVIDFPGGSRRRYSLSGGVLKLVSYDPAPSEPAEGVAASQYDVVEPLTEFAPVPGRGWMFVADPDGNHIEKFGTL